MHKLTFSQASPYVRKVMLASFFIGINQEILLINQTEDDYNKLRSQNPLGKIPILMKPNGQCLFDSRVIIEYFNSIKDGLFPNNQEDKDIILTKTALSEGITDAGLLYVYSSRYAGETKPSKIWQDLQISKINDSLSFIDNEISNWDTRSKIYISHIGLVVALDYLNFRKIFNWKNKYNNISGWHDNLKNKLPGYFETYPSD